MNEDKFEILKIKKDYFSRMSLFFLVIIFLFLVLISYSMGEKINEINTRLENIESQLTEFGKLEINKPISIKKL